MDEWGKRELRTSELVRLCAGYLLKKNIIPKNIYGLCALTWITKNPRNDAYIRSTKLPALSAIFDEDFLNYRYEDVAKKISELTGEDTEKVTNLIYEHTGYTRFYMAFRNSSEQWIKDNFDKIKPLISIGYNIKNESDEEVIISSITMLPKIPKGNNAPGRMSPEFILSPLFFSLDYRLRFPLINGNKGVKKILKQLKVRNKPLLIQFQAISTLIGKGGIRNSIDIDRLGGDLPHLINFDGNLADRKSLEEKNENELNLKDENDVNVIYESLSTTKRRLHNNLTNLLFKKLSPTYYLQEGLSKENMFDVLVKNINPDSEDLLIEVKSSVKMADIRMAVGQLMDYSRQLENYKKTYRAVFTPEKPDKNVLEFLNFYNFHLIWMEEEKIFTNCNKLLLFDYKEI
jgi:hypothetical protein